jgi:hypothetical protein
MGKSGSAIHGVSPAGERESLSAGEVAFLHGAILH